MMMMVAFEFRFPYLLAFFRCDSVLSPDIACRTGEERLGIIPLDVNF